MEESIELKFKKDDLYRNGIESHRLYDWCLRNKIKTEEPLSKKTGLYETFIIKLDTIEKQFLFSQKYLTVLKKFKIN